MRSTCRLVFVCLVCRISLTLCVVFTAVHCAVVKGATSENIQTLAMSNPQWITARNNGGYSVMQLLCRTGRLDAAVTDLFIRMVGVENLLGTPDPLGNTCLHSAMRVQTDPDALKVLIAAYPEAITAKTTYGHTPLHLACCRGMNVDIIRHMIEVHGCHTILLVPDASGQTPVSIVLDMFHRQLDCENFAASSNSTFQSLLYFVQVLHHRTIRLPEYTNVVHACVALHRRNIRLHPAFIRQVIQSHPLDVQQPNADGHYPIHVEASIPIEKITGLLNAPAKRCPVHRACHERSSVLRLLLDTYPDAAKKSTPSGFLLPLLLENGRPWDSLTAMIAQLHPAAIDGCLPTPYLLDRVRRDCGPTTLFQLLRSQPANLWEHYLE